MMLEFFFADKKHIELTLSEVPNRCHSGLYKMTRITCTYPGPVIA